MGILRQKSKKDSAFPYLGYYRSEYARLPLKVKLLGVRKGAHVPNLTPAEDLAAFGEWALRDLRDASGLTEAYIDASNCYRIEADSQVVASGLGLKPTEENLQRICYAGPWLEITYLDPRRPWLTWASRFKPRVPFKLDSGESAKYLTRKGQKPRVYFPSIPPTSKSWNDLAVPLIITEGEKKADAANQAGFVAVSIPGVWAWTSRNPSQRRNLINDLKRVPVADRDVYLVFDSDLRTNPKVRRALNELADALFDRGANVHVVYLPRPVVGSRKTGLDDYLLESGAEGLRRVMERAELYREPQKPLLPAAPGTAQRVRDEMDRERDEVEAAKRETYARSAKYDLHCDKCRGGDPCNACLPKASDTRRSGRCDRARTIFCENRTDGRRIFRCNPRCNGWNCDDCRPLCIYDYVSHSFTIIFEREHKQDLHEVTVRSKRHREGLVKHLRGQGQRFAWYPLQGGGYFFFVEGPVLYRPRREPTIRSSATTPDALALKVRTIINAIRSPWLNSEHPAEFCAAWAMPCRIRSTKKNRKIEGVMADGHDYQDAIARWCNGAVKDKPVGSVDDSHKYGLSAVLKRFTTYTFATHDDAKAFKEALQHPLGLLPEWYRPPKGGTASVAENDPADTSQGECREPISKPLLL